MILLPNPWQASCVTVMTAVTIKPEIMFNCFDLDKSKRFDLDLIGANIPPMGIIKLSIVPILVLLSGFSDARPISYPGGSTFMARHDARQNSLYYHYSPTYKLSVGLEAVNDYTIDETYSLARMTYLLYRKNTAQSQRNLDLAGGVSPEDPKTHFYSIHGDWESRRWFSGFNLRRTALGETHFNEQSVQLGVAPYLGDYGDLHTWIMAKIKRDPLNGHWQTYPVLKLYQGDLLIEMGYSQKTHWDLHFMFRF